MEPVGQSVFPLPGVLTGPPVCPFADAGLDEAFGFAVCLGRIWFGVNVADAGVVTNSIAARITPNGAYRQAVVQAAMRHAVKA